MNSHTHCRGGGALAATLPGLPVATGAGIQNQAGRKNTTPSQPRPSHCPSQPRWPCIAATASPDTTMPSPMPAKCRPSSGRWPWRISQLSTSPEAISSPAVLDTPATKRSAPHR